MKYLFVFSAALVAVLAGSALSAAAQPMPVPATLQAAIFKKVITLDRTLTAKRSARMLLVYGPSATGQYGEVLSAFKSAGLTATAVAEDHLAGAIGQADLLYLMPGTSSATPLSKANGVLTLTGTPSTVEAGRAAVGIGIKDGKPEILVHLGQLKAEGHELSSDLLKLARLIQ